MHGTHRRPPTIAEPSGLRFTLTLPSTFSVRASTRVTTFVSCDTYSEWPSPVTQSAPGSFNDPVTWFVRGSMRTRVPAVWSVTQMKRPIAEMPFGSTPTLIAFTTFVAVIRETVPTAEFVTHADPNPHSMSYGAAPTRTVAVTFPVRESMRVALPVRFATAHTAPGADARLKTRAPTFTRATTLPLAGSTRSTSPIERPPTQTEPPPAASP